MSAILSTIRLQFHGEFTLDDASGLVDYFARLGVSHIYASPLLASRAGSTHGYDGIDPTRLDPEIGDEAALARLVARLRERGMGLILDIVPNHVAVGGSENRWWQDVLMWGQDSRYACFFDIDWQSPDPLLTGKVLVPFLGDQYGEVLHSGDLILRFDPERGSFHVDYHEHRFPIDPRHYGSIVELAADADLRKLAEPLQAPGADGSDLLRAAQEVRQALRQAHGTDQGRAALDGVLALFDGTDEAGARRLNALLERQHYRLAWWRAASDDINWRRFFDITELGGLRVELPEVFEEAHSEIFYLVKQGWIDGVRVDHVDGLVDPGGYCRKLRERLDTLAEERPPEAPARVALYVEKILAAGEPLHSDWGVDGTTGYEFMNDVSALQHDPEGEDPLRALWRQMSERSDDFLLEERLAREEMLNTSLVSEFEACSRALLAVARQDLTTRDFTLGAIRRTLAALIKHFPVYRTYADEKGRPVQDQPFFELAALGAREELHPPEILLLDQLERWLGGEAPEDCPDPDARALRLGAITRFQQLTSPVAAKAVEDTAGYRSAVLISRNDVGFDPESFSHPPEDFHRACEVRMESFPGSLVATATHDHKRGEDVRARLAVLSERARPFVEQVQRWKKLAEPLRESLSSGPAPSLADELILYQILLGAWPLELDCSDEQARYQYRDRIIQWQEKALREAKLRSHWLWPDTAYESACRAFVIGVIDHVDLCRDIADFARTLDLPGAVNSLVQATLRMTVPGVPDLYQGTEFWDLSLVDPDNRRPVDYAARENALSQALAPKEALADWRDGRVKQALTSRLLKLRREYPILFLEGDYRPVEVLGAQARHIVAFIREHEECAVLVVVPRLSSALLGDASIPLVPPQRWEDARLRVNTTIQGEWRDAFDDRSLQIREEVPVAELLADFPVGVYVTGECPGQGGTGA